jgi:outer membrane immunogenic protein
MRPQLLAATALTSTIGFLVFPAQADPFNWSGFYLGLAAGAVSSQDTVTFDDQSGGILSLPSSVKVPAVGELANFTAGYDWQNGQFVYGLAADAALVKLNGSASDGYSVSTSLNTLLSLRARFGFAFDRMMLFATAGVAGGDASFNADVGKGSASGSGRVVGGIVGVGGQYAVNDNVAITGTLKYYSLSTLSGSGDAGKGTPEPYGATYKPAGIIFETGLNVRF